MRQSRSSWLTWKKQVDSLILAVHQYQHQEWSQWRSSSPRVTFQASSTRQSKPIASSNDLTVISPRIWWTTWSTRSRQLRTQISNTLTSSKAAIAQTLSKTIIIATKCSIKMLTKKWSSEYQIKSPKPAQVITVSVPSNSSSRQVRALRWLWYNRCNSLQWSRSKCNSSLP